ncbi:MAG: hypothetical protein K9M54_02140 [Kiritimatiellales bacterium]|nr:hypothetical protein [Kiritimatiellales bacterium]
MDVRKGFSYLSELDTRAQSMVAIVLLAVIPALSLFYMGTVIGQGASQFSLGAKSIVFLLTVIVASSGFLVLRKYPANIIKLRQYIAEIAAGTIPDRISLVDTKNSDDIKYIEESFNSILEELRQRIQLAEENLRVEHELRETIEHQQHALLEAERHRAMIQTLGAACHHIGQPATALRMRLYLLRDLAANPEELQEIEQCTKAVQTISDVLQTLREVGEFKTEPYLHDGGSCSDEVLVVET